jgi:monofunctional biosynthetic peptidoglycan transglycosylase
MDDRSPTDPSFDEAELAAQPERLIPVRSLANRLWRRTKRVLLSLFIAQLLYLVALRWVDPPITATQAASWFAGYGLKRKYVDRKNMSPAVRLAVMASEDQLFPDHHGFDWKSMELAMSAKTTKHQRVRGASTISQQVAKNVFLWQGRSWIRKGLEAYFTFMIELVWGKDRILEVYLNVAEMGKGVFGVEAASRLFFGKSSRALTATEAAMIAASLPNPKKFTVKPLSLYVSRRYPWVLQQMGFLQDDPDIRSLVR